MKTGAAQPIMIEFDVEFDVEFHGGHSVDEGGSAQIEDGSCIAKARLAIEQMDLNSDGNV